MKWGKKSVSFLTKTGHRPILETVKNTA